MRWYVKHEDGDIWGPMSKEEAEKMRDQLDDAMMFNERIFSSQFVTSAEVERLILDLGGMETCLKSNDPLSAGASNLIQRAIDALTLLSAKKVVTGTIQGGVLELDEVSEGVEVDIRDYDTDGVDEELVEEDASGTHFQAG